MTGGGGHHKVRKVKKHYHRSTEGREGPSRSPQISRMVFFDPMPQTLLLKGSHVVPV